LSPDQPAVKESQSGAGHHQDQGRADQHPGVISGALGGPGGGFQGIQFGLDIRRRLRQYSGGGEKQGKQTGLHFSSYLLEGGLQSRLPYSATAPEMGQTERFYGVD